MKKLKAMIMAVVCIIFVLSGCGNREENENTLIYGSGDYTSINPAVYEHGEINSLIFNGLTTHGERNEIVPSLAKSWSFDESSNTYTFLLREDVLWHDGEKFTGEDVKFTIESIQNPDNGSEIASNYEEIKRVNVVSDYEVQIVLTQPCVAMLDYLTVGILPKHLLEGKNLITDSFNQKPIGTGAYQLADWDMGQSITLVRNSTYFGNKPAIEKIIFKIINDTKVRALQLKSGEIDFAQITPRDLNQFSENENYHIYLMKTADYRGILYNFNNEFFQKHHEIANAFSYAIDRQKIVDTVLLGHGQKAYSPLQAGPYYNDVMEEYEYNPEKTVQLLESSGWKKNDKGFYEMDGEELKFTIICSEGDQVRVDMANICAQQLGEVGANVNVAVKADIDWAGQEAYLIGWGSPFDPDDHTYKVFGTEKGSNFSGYSNQRVDEILTKARETENEEERMKAYKVFQEELTKDMPYTFLAYVDAIYVSKKEISGITEDTVLGHHGVGIFWNVTEWTVN